VRIDYVVFIVVLGVLARDLLVALNDLVPGIETPLLAAGAMVALVVLTEATRACRHRAKEER
jgi:hypothetical protein